MTDRKTSTFILHHDRCDPSKWTVSEWNALVNFVRTGSLAYAAQLSRAGLQLKLDDRHVETGGTAEHIGFSPVANNDVQPDYIAETVEDIVDDFLEPTEIAAIYRGPTQYAVRYGIGDEDGNYDGSETEVFETIEEAEKFAASMSLDDAEAAE
jgi:hypothetical protein